jgi:hypothetical protein
MKLKTQIAVIVLGLAVSTSLLSGADMPTKATSPNLIGVWQAVRYGVNCNTGQDLGNSFPALITFHSDGTMTGDTGPFGATDEYGSWKRESGNRNYSFREVFYFYDENEVFAGSGIIAANVHLTDANSLMYSSTIEIYDADGNLLFTACGRATGERFQ